MKTNRCPMPSSRSFTLFSLLCLLVLVSLGTWQLMRREEKIRFLESLEQAQYRPPTNIDNLTSYVFPQPLIAKGQFLPGKTLMLSAKTHQGKLGVYILDVFKTLEGNFLLVQRGWTQEPSDSPTPTYPLTLKGMGRTPSPPTYFQPKNTPPTYYGIDLKLLSQELAVPLLPYYIISYESYDPHIIPTNPFPRPPNNHLQYAITWYALALFLMGMLWYRRHMGTRTECL